MQVTNANSDTQAVKNHEIAVQNYVFARPEYYEESKNKICL
jgi:hypothetical protein